MNAQEKVLKIARTSYVESDVFPTNSEEAKQGLGDGLATFIYNELMDVTTGYADEAKCLELAIDAMDRAKRELDFVICGLSRRLADIYNA